MRPDGVAEQRLVGAALDAVGAAVLDVGPARRQIGDACDVVEDDRGVAQRRPDDAIAAAGERRDQRLQAVTVIIRRCATCAGLSVPSAILFTPSDVRPGGPQKPKTRPPTLSADV